MGQVKNGWQLGRDGPTPFFFFFFFRVSSFFPFIFIIVAVAAALANLLCRVNPIGKHR